MFDGVDGDVVGMSQGGPKWNGRESEMDGYFGGICGVISGRLCVYCLFGSLKVIIRVECCV